MKMLELVIIFVLYINGINLYKWLFFITLSFLCTNICLSQWRRHKSGKIISNVQNASKDDYLIFNEIEKTLIQAIVECSKNKQHFTVNEMNVVLGVKNKSIEIQKKVRTESIIRINHKFNVNFNLDTVFIERVRSIEDRRYFNYYINNENIKIYLKNSKLL